jgi:hypothetical protein
VTKPVTTKKPAKTARRAVSAPAKTALTRIPAPATQTWDLKPAEVDIIKNHVAKGATDSELQFCLGVARHRKLDPFKGQIWFVKRKDKTAEGGARWIPMTSIDGLLHLAARDHKDFGSSDDPVFGPMKEIKWSYYEKSGKFMAPEWATVSVWKKGDVRPTTCTVYWEEIYPEVGASPMVREKPRLMLGKCALAQAIRRAYPDTGGIYVPEEFQGPAEFTDSGRAIERAAAPVNEHEQKYLEREKEQINTMLTPAQREVVERKMQQAKVSPSSEGNAVAAKESGGGGTVKPQAEATAPDNYDGLSFKVVDDKGEGMVHVFGMQSALRAAKEWIAKYWCKNANPPGCYCTIRESGALQRRLEENNIRFRVL